MSSTVGIPLIQIGESSQRASAFIKELLSGQALSPAFTNSNIITGLMHKHRATERMVIQKLDEKNTLFVFTEGEDIKKIWNTL